MIHIATDSDNPSQAPYRLLTLAPTPSTSSLLHARICPAPSTSTMTMWNTYLSSAGDVGPVDMFPHSNGHRQALMRATHKKADDRRYPPVAILSGIFHIRPPTLVSTIRQQVNRLAWPPQQPRTLSPPPVPALGRPAPHPAARPRILLLLVHSTLSRSTTICDRDDVQRV